MKVLKTIKVNSDELKENFIIRCEKRSGEVLKIVSVNNEVVLCVPYKEVKDKIFGGVRERKNFYKTIAVKLYKVKNKDWDVEVYGKHLSNLEKKKEEKEIRTEKKGLRIEIEQESKKEMSDLSFIEKRFAELEKVLISKMNDKIDSVVDTLRNEGKYYGFKYYEFTIDEVAHKGIKKLGEEGYKFVFDINNKLVFIKDGGKK